MFSRTNKRQAPFYFLPLDYVTEWVNAIEKEVSKLKKEDFADEDIGIVLAVSTKYPGRYVSLFQQLNQIYSRTKTTVQFDHETLSQEKTVVIICG